MSQSKTVLLLSSQKRRGVEQKRVSKRWFGNKDDRRIPARYDSDSVVNSNESVRHWAPGGRSQRPWRALCWCLHGASPHRKPGSTFFQSMERHILTQRHEGLACLFLFARRLASTLDKPKGSMCILWVNHSAGEIQEVQAYLQSYTKKFGLRVHTPFKTTRVLEKMNRRGPQKRPTLVCRWHGIASHHPSLTQARRAMGGVAGEIG